MNEHGEFEKNDVVLLEDTGDEFSGRVGRVLDEHNGVSTVRMVVPETGKFVDRIYPAKAMGIVMSMDVPHETQLLLETCCSVCNKLNWDNEGGGYNETHLNEDTGVHVKCDESGKLYVDGDLVPPAV